MKKQNTLKPDTAVKEYWRDNEHFSDFLNACLFNGQAIIKSCELEDQDTEASLVHKRGDTVDSITAARDNVKLWAEKYSPALDINFALLGIESNMFVDYSMPIRIMGYDYVNYKRQYDSNAKKYKNATDLSLTSDEYLSRMRKKDRFIPVITVVVYFGEKPWDGADSLHQILDIHPVLKEFVNDYKILIIEANNQELNFANKNNRMFFDMLKIVLNKNLSKKDIWDKAIEYSEQQPIELSVVQALAGVTGVSVNLDVLKKEDSGMCTFFNELIEEGREKGVAQGIEQGIAMTLVETNEELGVSKEDILGKLKAKLNISEEQALEYYNTYSKQSA